MADVSSKQYMTLFAILIKKFQAQTNKIWPALTMSIKNVSAPQMCLQETTCREAKNAPAPPTPKKKSSFLNLGTKRKIKPAVS
jgi:hypothetical protein